MVFEGVDHFDGILVGEDGEVGLRLKEEYVASFVVLADALDAVAGHHDAALSVGEGEEFAAGAMEDDVGGLVDDKLLAVAEDDDGLSFALGCHTGNLVDGDPAGFWGAKEYCAVVHQAVGPLFLDGEVAVFKVVVVSVFEAVGIESFAGQLAGFAVFHQSALEAAVDVVAGDVALFADAAPPTAMAVVVGPAGDLGSVAVMFEDDVVAVFDAHLVGGLLDETSVLGVEFPEAVAVALVVFAAGEESALLVEGFVKAALAGLGVSVADAHGAVVVVVGEDTGLEAVLEVALENFGAVLVGADPMPLAATLFVDLVLGHGTGGSEQHGRGEKEKRFFHCLQCMCVIICINYLFM